MFGTCWQTSAVTGNMRSMNDSEKGKLMFKLSLLVLLGLVAVVPSPITAVRDAQQFRVQCVSELSARNIAEVASLPEYPEEAEPGGSQGHVFAAMLFGTDGRLSKIKFYETPNERASESVKKALQNWKLKQLFDGGQQPIMTRTALRFNFIFEDGKGRVEVASEQEQKEFGGEWGKKACKSSLDE
jgi:outer membrane biosynthesis protein TonB